MYGAPCNSHNHICSCTYDPISSCMDVLLGSHMYVHDGFSICIYMSKSMDIDFQWTNVNINRIYNYLTMPCGIIIINYLNHSLTHGKIRAIGTIIISFIY